MSEFSKLVDVKFEDRTSYVASPNAEILALPFIHPWGPEMSNENLSYTEFMQKYQESYPLYPSLAVKRAAQDTFRAAMRNWVQIKRAFSTGMGYVLAQRCATGKFVYIAGATPACAVGTLAQIASATKPICRLKYSGFPTNADLGLDADYFGALKIKSTVPDTDGSVTVTLFVNDGLGDTNIEVFEGTIVEGTIVDGESFFIDDVINSKSEFITDFKSANTSLVAATPAAISAVTFTPVQSSSSTDAAKAGDYDTLISSGVTFTEAYAKLEDPDVTQYTLLISPVEPVATTGSGQYLVPDELYLIPADRKDINLLVGFPITADFTKATIQAAYLANQAKASEPKFFTLFLAAREVYNAFGTSYVLDGTAAWAGRMSNVASSVRLNQMPSARQYGPVAATLKESLTFNQVLELHEIGCNSIYNSAYGPCIFGIKTCHKRQLSYFGKANISRVTARLIKYVYPEVMNVIHTDTVNDPINRAKFQLAMNNIIDEFVANGNIRPESTVDVSDAINNDITTKGGEVLNVQFTIWFKKLVEKVNIMVVATDSSVNVSIS